MDNVETCILEDIVTHQKELEAHLEEMVSKLESDKQKINALHGAITTCKFFASKVAGQQSPADLQEDNIQMELPF